MSTSSQSWVGIDLGTSTTLVADGANVLALGTTNPWIPSVVALGDSGLVIGEEAEHLDPSRVLRSPKRYITESHHAEALERPPAGLDPLEALEQLLRVAVEKSRALGVDVSGQGVRLGCPAMWTGEQRRTLCTLAGTVGIDVEIGDLIEEPVAVGVSWILERRDAGEYQSGGRVVVVDAGGGTTDVAVIQAEDSTTSLHFSVLASDAISTAGDHIDLSVSSYLRDRDSIAVEEASDVELVRVSRFLKEALTAEVTAQTTFGRSNLTAALAREEFDDAFRSTATTIVRFTQAVVRSAMMRERDALAPDQIRAQDWQETRRSVDTVVLAGGTGRIPALRAALEECFGFPVVELASPQTAVVEGLAATVDYGRINLPRPPFDFVVSYTCGGRTVTQQLYDAFTPLYDWHEVFGGSPQYRRALSLECAPEGAVVRVACMTPGSNPQTVPLAINWVEPGSDGRDVTRTEHAGAFEVKRNGRSDLALVLKPDGTVVIDGTKYQIDEWPVVRGRQNRGALPPINVRRRFGVASDGDWRHH